MKILITGATGLVGTKLVKTLFEKGYDDIHVLTRDANKANAEAEFPVRYFEWDPRKQTMDPAAIIGVETIINLAGAGVADGRWSEERKREILDSRVNTIQLLMKTLKENHHQVKKFISASAIGIYGDRGDESLVENSTAQDTYLADVCKKWEDGVLNHDIENMKAHCIRVGIVLSDKGAALKKMLPAFKMGVAGILGDGKQFMSWIHVEDLVNQFIFLMENDCQEEIYNGVAPTPVTNKVFTKTLGKVLSRPTLFPVPAFVLKVIFGEMSTILLSSQRVFPSNFTEAGFKFKFSGLEAALNNLLYHDAIGEEILEKYQWINLPPEEVFAFFSDAINLEKITPKYLNFKVLTKNTDAIEKGTLIDYQLKLHGIPLKWQSKISAYDENKHFIDEQMVGPYNKWVHNHYFIPTKSGTLIKDHVNYKIPFGPLGRLFAGAFVKKDLNNIFNYRHKVISEVFAE